MINQLFIWNVAFKHGEDICLNLFLERYLPVYSGYLLSLGQIG